MEETLRTNLLELCRRLGRASKLSPGAVGRSALRDHTFFPRIQRGENFTIKTYDRVVRWCFDNWPADIDWPADIERPDQAAATPEPTGAEA